MKKLVIVLAVAMLSVGAFGRDFVDPAVVTNDNTNIHSQDNSLATSWCAYKAYPWTWGGHWEWDSINVATIKVYMDVGMWVSVYNCTGLKIKVNQDTVTTYSGSTTMKVSCNIPLTFGYSWAPESTFIGALDGDPSFNPSSLTPGTNQVVTVTLKLKNVDLSAYAGGTNCQFIGTLTVKVKPTLTVTIPSSGGC